MRSVRIVVAAGAASLLSSAALAADMPSIMPPPPQQYYQAPVEDFGGWYLRGDIGMTTQQASRISNPLDTTLNVTGPSYVGTELSGSSSFDLGVGYRFNNWLRADLTAEYRNKATVRGSVFGQFTAFGGTFSDVDNYSANLSSLVFLANAYVDLGTWWCITPFIGAGVGTAYHRVISFRDDGLNLANFTSNPSTFFGADGTKMDLAWALHAGLGYRVNQNLTIELAYRYAHLGDAVTTAGGFPFDLSFVGTHFWTVKDITSNDLKLGVRWTCCEAPPPPPPPLVRKG